MSLNFLKIIREAKMKYDKIFLYGTGKYAQGMEKYLESIDDCLINGFVISDGEHLDKRFIQGKVVLHLSEVPYQGCCFILSLHKKYHDEIIENLKSKSYSHIICFEDMDFDNIINADNIIKMG